MASGLNDKRNSTYSPLTFVLQWHVTAKCPQNCMHCYIGKENNEDYNKELIGELKFEDCIKVVDNYVETFNRWGVPVRINFTGGDPLLKEGFFELLKYSKSKGIQIGILGNPNFLDEETAKDLRDLGVDTYQLSIDGTEDTHDYIRRKKGLFKDTLRAARLLKATGIRSVIMFTLHKLNSNELIDVIRTVSKEGVSVFDFARLVPIGNGSDLAEFMIEPFEYRALLLKVFEEYRKSEEHGTRTRFGRKDHLWTLLYQELGLLRTVPNPSKKIYGGCGLGWRHLTLLADGRVLACRRLPLEIGEVPKQNFRDIFINSEPLNQVRKVELMEKCSICDLFSICRGCPAVPYGAYGNYFAPDPQCWKVLQ